MARAFSIGKAESAAISNLQTKVPPAVVSRLKSVIRPRGMRAFLAHDVLAKDVFNAAFSSGVGAYESWQLYVSNKEDNKLATRSGRPVVDRKIVFQCTSYSWPNPRLCFGTSSLLTAQLLLSCKLCARGGVKPITNASKPALGFGQPK